MLMILAGNVRPARSNHDELRLRIMRHNRCISRRGWKARRYFARRDQAKL
jgi:hypothetical protein